MQGRLSFSLPPPNADDEYECNVGVTLALLPRILKGNYALSVRDGHQRLLAIRRGLNYTSSAAARVHRAAVAD